jgi:integrase
MSTVYIKGGKWWCKIKGLKEPGKWSGTPTPYKSTPANKEAARRYATVGQKKIDERVQLLGASGPVTVKDYAEHWLGESSRKALASWPDMNGHLRNHVLPRIGGVGMLNLRARHLRDLVRELKLQIDAGKLSPKTVLNVVGTLRKMLHDAKFEEVIETAPEIDPAELPQKVDKDPEWRELATYERAEVIAILTSEKIPPERRIQYAMKALAGLRHGEVAGARWRSYTPDLLPLGKLTIARTYQDKSTKTKVPRPVPVHPELARMLEAWRKLWPEVYGDEPTPDDFIVPTRNRTPIDPDDAVVAFKVDLDEIGLRIQAGEHRDRGGHDLRAWFMSTAIEDGAEVAVLQRVTHTKKKDVVSGYTRLPWHVLCAAVAKLQVSLGDDPLPLGTSELPRQRSLRRLYQKRGLARQSKATPTGFEPVTKDISAHETDESVRNSSTAVNTRGVSRTNRDHSHGTGTCESCWEDGGGEEY